MAAESKIQPVNGRRCWGVRLVCGIQLNVNSRRHECEQAGRCIFAPKEQPTEPATPGVLGTSNDQQEKTR